MQEAPRSERERVTKRFQYGKQTGYHLQKRIKAKGDNVRGEHMGTLNTLA